MVLYFEKSVLILTSGVKNIEKIQSADPCEYQCRLYGFWIIARFFSEIESGLCTNPEKIFLVKNVFVKILVVIRCLKIGTQKISLTSGFGLFCSNAQTSLSPRAGSARMSNAIDAHNEFNSWSRSNRVSHKHYILQVKILYDFLDSLDLFFACVIFGSDIFCGVSEWRKIDSNNSIVFGFQLVYSFFPDPSPRSSPMNE